MRQAQIVHDLDELDDVSVPYIRAQVEECWQNATRESSLTHIRDACGAFFQKLDPIEAAMVEIMLARRPLTITAAKTFDDAGKGLAYPALAAAAVLTDGRGAFAVILACAIATAVSLALYPLLKQFVARERPLTFDPELGIGVAPIDRYSWPSGHSITATAFLVPFALAGSSLLPLIGAFALLVLWSRVALGHHYPSDVAGGVAIGAVISALSCLVVGV
ncbi:MAG: phosphatase PAP2 family protein [Acidobacteria bacterium]|nr:phosphatase PAP2 family protein [Acidobacteriota bacterium]